MKAQTFHGDNGQEIKIGDIPADLASFDEDLLLADLEIVSNRIERLKESIKKPRPNREEQQAELAAIEPLKTAKYNPTSRTDHWSPSDAYTGNAM